MRCAMDSTHLSSSLPFTPLRVSPHPSSNTHASHLKRYNSDFQYPASSRREGHGSAGARHSSRWGGTGVRLYDGVAKLRRVVSPLLVAFICAAAVGVVRPVMYDYIQALRPGNALQWYYACVAGEGIGIVAGGLILARAELSCKIAIVLGISLMLGGMLVYSTSYLTLRIHDSFPAVLAVLGWSFTAAGTGAMTGPLVVYTQDRSRSGMVGGMVPLVTLTGSTLGHICGVLLCAAGFTTARVGMHDSDITLVLFDAVTVPPLVSIFFLLLSIPFALRLSNSTPSPSWEGIARTADIYLRPGTPSRGMLWSTQNKFMVAALWVCCFGVAQMQVVVDTTSLPLTAVGYGWTPCDLQWLCVGACTIMLLSVCIQMVWHVHVRRNSVFLLFLSMACISVSFICFLVAFHDVFASTCDPDTASLLQNLHISASSISSLSPTSFTSHRRSTSSPADLTTFYLPPPPPTTTSSSSYFVLEGTQTSSTLPPLPSDISSRSFPSSSASSPPISSPSPVPSSCHYHFVIFLVGYFLMAASIPLASICCVSLLSKMDVNQAKKAGAQLFWISTSASKAIAPMWIVILLVLQVPFSSIAYYFAGLQGAVTLTVFGLIYFSRDIKLRVSLCNKKLSCRARLAHLQRSWPRGEGDGVQ